MPALKQTNIKPRPLGSVALGLPLYGPTNPTATQHLLNHVAWGVATQTYGALCFSEGAYVDHARNIIVRAALQEADSDPNMKFLFFHDQDCVVTEGTVEALMAHDLPVVGAPYFGRDKGHRPIAFELEPYCRVDALQDSGLQQVGGIGLGATLVNIDVFRKLTPHVTDDEGNEWWFRCQDNPDRNERRTGEDIWFAWKCRDLGIPIYLDTDLEAGHIGSVIIKREHFDQAKEGG